MRQRLPPLNPLRAFEASARHLQVAKAADELNVTPSAVSHQLKTLEAALGVTLFDRTKRRLKLTPQGAALLPSINAAFQTIADATAKIGDGAMAGDLVISCPVALTSRWLVRHIGEFLRQNPAVNLKLIPSNDDREIYTPAVDLCIRYGNGRWHGRRVTALCSVALFPVASPMLMNGPHPIRTVRDLQHHLLLCEDDGTEWARWLLNAAGHAADFRTVPLGNAHIALEGAVCGQGVALGDSVIAADDLAEGRLVRLFETTIPAEHAYHVVCRPELAETPLVGGFIQWLEAKIREG
ncbi:LysR family transcriptional regulator [Aliidongia dinghuensis]|uniref:LysR family transcriptional regulator n=1 Tax=Aliidongia dinghuensis TaxID=1867774 RepID=A0A8J3E4P3_9PROT|nr:transcriptional regulator GcvA [Aliidongia dinghuensis]GGF28845.1 LysR family transcriptional regulator [Aliidongia dinghuensis]